MKKMAQKISKWPVGILCFVSVALTLIIFGFLCILEWLTRLRLEHLHLSSAMISMPEQFCLRCAQWIVVHKVILTFIFFVILAVTLLVIRRVKNR